MITAKQRMTFLAVGAGSFLVGVVCLLLGFLFNEFALRVMGPCFMLTGVTWTVVVSLAFKQARIPHAETVEATTNGSGVATLDTVESQNKASFTFCVDDVTHATLTYAPGDNVITCASR